jgi:KUP system potassium uptake protein
VSRFPTQLSRVFFVQSCGTARIGEAFGPVMLVWFATIAVLGVGGILHRPGVLAAVNPATRWDSC